MATNDVPRQTEQTTDIDRRSVIKKGVVAATTAGAVWSAPTIKGLSLRPTYAAAQGGSVDNRCPAPVPANGLLVTDSAQDGPSTPFRLPLRNATPNAETWELVWSNRPYGIIPNLVLPPGVVHTPIMINATTWDHFFTSETTPLAGFQGLAITGDPVDSIPGGIAGDSNVNDVTEYLC